MLTIGIKQLELLSQVAKGCIAIEEKFAPATTAIARHFIAFLWRGIRRAEAAGAMLNSGGMA